MKTFWVMSLSALALGGAMVFGAGAVNTKEAVPTTAPVAPFTDPHWKKIVLSTDFVSEGAAFGDFNHDGVQDVVSGPYWYEGPDFAKRHEYTTPEGSLNPDGQYSHFFFSFTHSFKHDGWDDIIVVGFPGQPTWWFENPRGKETADGHWVRHTVFDVTDNESPNFCDLFGNGKPVLLCMSGGTVGYAQPDEVHPEQPWTWHAISPVDKKAFWKYRHGIGFGDVNGDGRNDILVNTGWYEQPADLTGDPLWKFHKAVVTGTTHGVNPSSPSGDSGLLRPVGEKDDFFGSGGAQMFVYDVNGDGRNDIITSLAAHGYGLAWFEQNADGSFTKHLITGAKDGDAPHGLRFSQIHALALADINGDGLMDIVSGKRFYAHHSHGDPEPKAPAVLYWFELKRDGHGGAEFIPHEIDNNSGVGTEVLAADINHNKRPAILVGNKKGTFVFLQRPDTGGK